MELLRTGVRAALDERLADYGMSFALKAARVAEKAAAANANAERRWREHFLGVASRWTPYLAIEKDDELFFLPTTAGTGRAHFKKLDWKEDRHLDRALRALHAAGLDAGRRVFLDVGAHHGTTTIRALRQHGFEAALAFEPEPENFRILGVNVLANSLDEDVQRFNVALSDRTGSAVLWLDRRGSTDHSLVWSTKAAKGSLDVPTTTLDALAAQGTVEPEAVGLLWMDVEGHELEVLTGARSLLRRSVPVVMEFTPRHLGGGRLAALHDLLCRSYTHVVDLRGDFDGVPAFAPMEALELFARRYQSHFTDLLVVHKPA